MKLGKKAAGLAVSAGAAAGLAVIGKKLAKREEVNVQLQLRDTSLQELEQRYRDALKSRRAEALAVISDTAERQVAAFLFDRMENDTQMLERITAEASVLHNGYALSGLDRLYSALLGPTVGFVLTAAAFGVLVYAKWQVEAELAAKALTAMNIAIGASAAVLLHQFLRLIYTLRRNRAENGILLEVTLNTEQKDREQYIENQCGAIAQDIEDVCRLLKPAARLDDPSLRTLADTYGRMYQADALCDYEDIGGYVLPRSGKALRDMGVEIITEYTPATAHLFDVTGAPGYGRSLVFKPALVVKSSGAVISRGEYVKDA